MLFQKFMGNLNKMFSEKSKNFCEFCEIINKKKELLIYDDDNIIVFHDIDKVSAVEHLLICPKNHISNTNSLDSKDIPLIEKIHKIGENILEQLRPNCSYR